MALIQCRECGKQVSDQASACPQCGAPVQGVRVAGTVTTQATGKKSKQHELLGGVAFGAGLLAAVFGGEPVWLWLLLAVAGLIWYFVARFAAWWHHG